MIESRGEPCRQKTQPNMRKQIPTIHSNLDITNVDHVVSSVTHYVSNAMLYVFEDNEAVIDVYLGCQISKDTQDCRNLLNLLLLLDATGLPAAFPSTRQGLHP